jgi:hypothetical protein
MSFASALNILQPTLPYYLAVKQFDLLRITPHRFEFHPHSAAPFSRWERVLASKPWL